MTETDYKEVLSGDPNALKTFSEGMATMIRRFCACIMSGQHFTLRIELHGNKGKLIHFRHHDDVTTRTHGENREQDVGK